MLTVLKQYEENINKERNEMLHKLDMRYMHYINSLLQQKMLICRRVNDLFDEKVSKLQKLKSYKMNQQFDHRINVVNNLLFSLCDAAVNKQENTENVDNNISNTTASNDFASTLPPLDQDINISKQNQDINTVTSVEPFVAHMSFNEAKQLSINDKIDHRDFVGLYIPSIIADKNDTKLKIHYIGWDKQWDIWSDYQTKLYCFAKHESISRRKKHRFSDMKIGDFLDVRPIHSETWTIGEIVEFDKHSGQIKVVYTVETNTDGYYKYQWSHLDDKHELQPLKTKQPLDKPSITHKTIIQNNINKQKQSTKKYCCVYCSFTFSTYSVLREHVKVIHTDRKHPCIYCPVAIQNKNGLETHTKQHTRTEQYQCNLCYKLFGCTSSFMERGQLTWHKRKTHKLIAKQNINSQPKRTTIPKKRRQKIKLTIKKPPINHVVNTAKLAGESGYHCLYCTTTSFKHYSSLRNHLKVAHLKTGYLCYYCPLIFATDNGREAHTWQHTQDSGRMFKCDACRELFHCETSFQTKHNLTTHKLQVHKITQNMVMSQISPLPSLEIPAHTSPSSRQMIEQTPHMTSINPYSHDTPKRKLVKVVKLTKSMIQKAIDAENKKRVVKSEIWKLWKQKHEEISAEYAKLRDTIGTRNIGYTLVHKLREEVKKFILQNGLCKESDWRSVWDTYSFVMTESVLFDLIVKRLPKSQQNDLNDAMLYPPNSLKEYTKIVRRIETSTNISLTGRKRVKPPSEYPPLTYEQAKRMITYDLRKELYKRGIDDTGPKKELLNRVKKAVKILKLKNDEEGKIEYNVGQPYEKKRRLNDSSSKCDAQDVKEPNSETLPSKKSATRDKNQIVRPKSRIGEQYQALILPTLNRNDVDIKYGGTPINIDSKMNVVPKLKDDKNVNTDE